MGLQPCSGSERWRFTDIAAVIATTSFIEDRHSKRHGEPADLELSVEGWSTPLAIFTKQALSSLVSVGPARECTKEDLWLASGLLARPRSRHTTSSPMIASPSKQALCKPSWRPSSDL